VRISTGWSDGETNREVGFHLHGLAVEQRRTKPPSPDCRHGRAAELSVFSFSLNLAHRTVLRDDDPEMNRSGYLLLAGRSRVFRQNLLYQPR
jgi:hypothetical protein